LPRQIPHNFAII